tara:strand:+ start:65 stop:532 length:468 start_codon:yes stop_codon:yes gene_type:complete
MKKSIFTLSLIFTALLSFNSLNAQEEKSVAIGGAEISFDKETHDYGQIEQHANGECVFVFTNNGTEPLKITNAKGSCGCTVPQWPREEIAAGATGEIKVKYDTKRIGMINKSVTIQSNATNTPTKIIRIKGEVKAPKTNATAVKPSQGPVSKPAE